MNKQIESCVDRIATADECREAEKALMDIRRGTNDVRLSRDHKMSAAEALRKIHERGVYTTYLRRGLDNERAAQLAIDAGHHFSFGASAVLDFVL